MPKLFGTSGIRGPADTLFTNEFCTRLGLVFGTWLKNQGKSGYVAICNDPRDSGPRIKTHISTGLAASGWEILDEGVIPTPALTYFASSDPRVGGGIAVTGSHIAADLNGVKLISGGEEISKDNEPEIESLFSQLASASVPTDIEPIIIHENRAKEAYLDLLKSQADLPYPNWKIVVDTANGTQTQIIRDLFPDLNLDYACTDYCDIQSPHFSPRDTEVESHFSDLIRQVLTRGADLGVGFDADGDRVIFVDHTGRFIPGDYSCSLIARQLSPPCLVTPISTSSVIDHLGIKVFRTPVGSTHVAAVMKQHHCTFGFEPNGGSIDSALHYGRDGGVTLIKFLNTLKSLGLSASAAYDSLPKFHLFRDKLDCPQDKFSQVYSVARQNYSKYPVSDIDGIKIELPGDEWLLFRGSGNAPEFRVFAQSPDSKRAQSLGHTGLNLVRSVIHPRSLQSLPSRQPPQDSLSVLRSIDAFPDQCRQVISDIALQHIPRQCYLVKNIVISGMGGSALGGRIITSLARQTLRIPVTVSTEYHLPAFVDDQSLVVIVSYSGNTAESLFSLAEARARGAQIYVITSGGELARQADEYNLSSYIFDPVHNPSSQPRMGLGYNILALITLLARCQLIHPTENLSRLPDFLKSRQSQKRPLSALARKLSGKLPVIVASEHLKGAAHSLKNQFNENSKTFACFFDLPEANHHLLEGLSFPHSNPDNLAFLFIESRLYHPELAKIYPLTKQVVTKQHLPVYSLALDGPSSLFETMELVQSGAYLAYFLSQVNAVDPGPIPWVDWYKDQLSKT